MTKVVAALAVAGVLAGCGGAPQRVTLHGAITSSMCVVGQVTIRDGNGKVVGLSQPDAGKMTGSFATSTRCVQHYRTTVPQASFYQLSLDGESGTVRTSYDDLKSHHFTLNLAA